MSLVFSPPDGRGEPKGRHARAETRSGKAQRGAGVGHRPRGLWPGPASKPFFRALHSCTGVKVSIRSHFHTSPPVRRPPATRFTLIFQRLGPPVKRCCSNSGLLLPSQSVRGGCRWAPRERTRRPSRWPRHSPCGRPARVPLQGHQHKTPEPAERRCPLPDFSSRLRPRELTAGRNPRRPRRFPFASPPQRKHLHISGLAPNCLEPVTWLPHLPIKIIT